MNTLRLSEHRGHANLGWLDTKHSFSFGHYHDPAHMGYGALRVINEDIVEPGAGFDTHGHRDMEIVTWVLEGALEHKDSIGTGSIIRPGEVQRMTAGTGIRHSEFNASQSDRVKLLQIWILPETQGLTPSYEQKAFPEAERQGALRRARRRRRGLPAAAIRRRAGHRNARQHQHYRNRRGRIPAVRPCRLNIRSLKGTSS